MKSKQTIGWKVECSYGDLPETFYTEVEPNIVSSPQLVLTNDELAISLGLDEKQ